MLEINVGNQLFEVDFLTSKLEDLGCSESVSSHEMVEGMEKYNPDRLKEDIANARKRVGNLKRELQEETDKVRYQQDGIDKLEEINRTVAVSGGQLEEARLKVNEMKEIREQLLAGEQEKISLLQELLQQRRDFRGSDLSCNQMGSSTSINSTGSGAMSPYMGSEENLAYEQPFSKRQLRKDYQIALQRIADLHGKIELTNYYLELYKNGSEQHRYDLYQEREALVIELERFAAYARTEEERIQVEHEREMLMHDLLSARDMSEKVVEDRLQLEKERQILKQQLYEKTQQSNLLQMRLKSLSTSTMSVSSSSSRGSYGSHGSLSASSRGSLNSLVHHPSHPDSYQQSPGNQEHYTQYHLPSTSCPPIYEAHILATKENAEAVVVSSNVNGFSSPYLSTSGTSLASRDSTPTSYSSPVSLYNNSYYSASGESPLQHQGRVQQTYAEVTTYEETSALERFQPQADHDSGVFEASSNRNSVIRQDSGHSSGVYCEEERMETAQIRIGLEYRTQDEKLVVSVEKGRNIKALCFQDVNHVYLKGRLVPYQAEEEMSFKTRKSSKMNHPVYQDQFIFKIGKSTLLNKTLQLDLYGTLVAERKVACLGGVQISLADFDSEKPVGMKWYNLLSSSFMESVKNSVVGRSVSSVSLESAALRSRELALMDLTDSYEHLRLRSNSFGDNNIAGIPNLIPNGTIHEEGGQHLGGDPRQLMGMSHQDVLDHIRSHSEEGRPEQTNINIGRSVSDCTGNRNASFRIPFDRMGVGRQSVRRNRRLADIKNQRQRHVGRPAHTGERQLAMVDKPQVRPAQQMTPLDLELELQARYAKQVQLREEISRLRDIKQLMDCAKRDGVDELPDWLNETGELHALLDEAKHEAYEQLSGNAVLDPSQKFAQLRKTDPKQASVVGFQEKMRYFTTPQVKVPVNPEVHWV